MPHDSPPVLMYATPPPKTVGALYQACLLAARMLFRTAVIVFVMVSLTVAAVLAAGWLTTQVPALSP